MALSSRCRLSPFTRLAVLQLALSLSVRCMAAFDTDSATAHQCPSVCYCSPRMVDCDDRALAEIPDDMPDDAHYVNLRGNNIEGVDPDRLSRLVNVKDLSMAQNQISTLRAGSFASMIRLSQLDLSENAISEIRPGAFRNLSQLLVLNLKGNQLESIDGLFAGLTTLESLHLSSNRLVAISGETFSGLDELSYLSLSDNQLTSVSQSAFATMTKLSFLVLSGNSLKRIDGIWSDLSTLSSLELSSCQLTKIPAGLPTYLKHLKLSNNSLTFIAAADLSQIRYLVSIVLDDNRIDTIEGDAFAHAPYLSSIQVNGNRLRVLPSPIPASVKVFAADGNQIQRVFPSNFDHDSNMTTLTVKNNSIEHLAANTFSLLTRLSSLFLDRNKIRVMYRMTYTRLKNLAVLSLDSNPVREVETRALGGLSGLSSLVLSEVKGEVTGITGDTFRDALSLRSLDLQGSPNLVTLILNNTDVLRGLRSLRYLNLMKTNLTHLDVDFLSWLPKLRSVKLIDNPWQCDDKLLPFRRALEKSPRIFQPIDKIICQYPDYLSGTPVIKLKYEHFTPMTTLPAATTVTTTTSTTPSSSTSASLFVTNENTDGESTTNDTTSRSLSSTVTTEMSTSTSASPSKTLLSSTTARSDGKTTQTGRTPVFHPSTTQQTNDRKTTDITNSLPLETTNASPQSTTRNNVRQSSTVSSRTTPPPTTMPPTNVASSHPTPTTTSIFQTISTPSERSRPSSTTRGRSVATSSTKTTMAKVTTRATTSKSQGTTVQPNRHSSDKTFATQSSQGKQSSSYISPSSSSQQIVSSTLPSIGTTITKSPKDKKGMFKTTKAQTKHPQTNDTTAATSRKRVTNSAGDSRPSLKPGLPGKGNSPRQMDGGISGSIPTTATKTRSTDAIEKPQGATVKSSESRLPAESRSKKNDHTKAMIIGVSVSFMALVIVTIAILIFIRYRRQRKRVPINQNDQPPYSFKQEDSTSSDAVLIFTHLNGPEMNPGSPMSTEYKDISDGDKHSGSQEAGCPGNPKNPNGAKRKNNKFGMNCFRSNSKDDSEMLMHAWDEAHH